MRKWLRKALFGLVVLGLFALLFWWLFVPAHRIHRDSFDQIQQGLTENQVVDVLGVPAGDYSTIFGNRNEEAIVQVLVFHGKQKFFIPTQIRQRDIKETVGSWVSDKKSKLTYQEWRSDNCIVFIFFEDGKVFTMGATLDGAPFLERFREWVGL